MRLGQFSLEAEQFADMSEKAIERIEEISKESNSAEEEIEGLEIEFEGLGEEGASVSSIFKNVGASILNGLASMAISAAISLIITGLDHLINRAKYIEQAAEQARSAISSIRDDLSNTSSVVEEVGSRYAELAQQVNNLGTASQNQGSLSNDEYQEFLDISNQLAEVFPTLTQGYTDNGDALIGLAGSVETITDRLNELYEAEQRAANQKIYDNMKDVWKGYKEDVQGVNGSDSILNQKRNLTNYYTVGTSKIATAANPHGKTYEATIQQQREAFNKAIVNGQSELIKYVPTATREAFDKVGLLYFDYFNEEGKQIKDLSGDQVKAINAAFVEINKEYDDEIAKLDNQLQNKNMDLANDMLSSFEAVSEKYESYSDEQKILLENIARNYDFSQLTDDEGNILKWDDAFKKFTDDIESTLDLSEDQLKELSSTWTGLMSLKLDEGVYAENLEKLRTYLRTIAALLGYSVEEVSSLLGYDSAFEKYDQARERLGYSEKPGSRAEAEKNAEIDKFLSTLTPEELEYFATINIDEYKSLDEIKEALGKMQNYADSNVIEVRTNVGAAENLDAMKTAFDDLDTAYMSSVKNQDSSGNATNNIASAADIQGVNDAFGGVTEITADTELADINALSNALEVYDTALIENKGDAVAAQKAADQLATAYVDLSDVLDDLTEENKDYYKEQLKANGITNAEQVINTRLSKQYQKTRAALEDLSKSIAQNRKYLDAGVEAGSDYETAIENIQGDVQKLLTIYDDTGKENMDLTPEINTQFIKDNLADIEAATEGDIDALDRLRLAVARMNAEKAYVDIDMPYDAIQGQLDHLMSKVTELDAMDIEVGASVDDSAFIASLQNMIDSGQTTADAVSAAFESMGYNVEFTHKTATVELVKYVEEHGANGMPSYVPQKMKEQLSVPEMKITRVSKSSGAKVSNYNGGSSSSTGGSGGGGSDSGSDDSSEETFDWIEVKLERLQEQLEDLGKVADNVYDKWGTRNEAVADQIKTLTEEIQLQKDAAQGYLDKANSIDLSEEYKKKVREGKIEIETVTDQTTIDNINDYTDYWNKYKDAMSTVKELSITRSEYQQTLFDNISAEYEDAITNIEKTVDILNEQITRTEEFGFFVDEQYYNSLLDQEKQNYSKLENERNELINKLNEGIEKGYIEPYSEAWNDMYQSIMDVNIAMEESATNTRKLNNEIRQLKWDKFDWVEEQMSDYATEADFLIKLLQGENNYEDDGNFNNRGFAQAALVGAKYNDTLAKMERYKKEIAAIDKEMSEDPTKAADKEMIARKQALVDEYRNSIEAAEDEKQAMQSLVQEGINKHLEALQELINKYKESLDAEKDLYDWQKNVADQTKNIVELEKQLAAYEGDTSEETRKKRQELQSQLNSAQQSLEESQWDRYISETGELLDNMYGDYEDYLNGKLEEVKVLMDSMIGYINDNTTAVKNGIDEVKKEYGLTTQNFEGFAEGQSKLLNEWQDGKFVGDIAAVRTSLSNFYDTYVKISEKNTKDIIDTIGKVVVVDSENGKVGVQEPKPATGNGTTPGSNNSDKPGGGDDKSESGLKDQSTGEGKWVQNDDTSWSYFNPDGTWMHDTWFQDPDDGYWYYFDPTGRMLTNQFVGDNENEGYWLGDDGRMLPDKFTWQEDDTGWWFGDGNGNYIHDDEVWINGKQYRFNSQGYWYAKGTKGVPFNQLAYTQEDGQELVYHTDSGALLTPLGQGDMVFTNAMTQRLWEIASGTMPFGGVDLSAPDINSNLTQNVNAENTFNFTLPNVTNADEFIDELRNNERFEKIVQEVSIGRMMGNNKLNKYKY